MRCDEPHTPPCCAPSAAAGVPGDEHSEAGAADVVDSVRGLAEAGLVGSASVGEGLPSPSAQRRAEELMQVAIDVARTTPAGDVPVGAAILDPLGNILAKATNRRETDKDPTAHAEVLAIREATRVLKQRAGLSGDSRTGDGSEPEPSSVAEDAWRLTDCTLVVTLEPCAMCAGALVGARVGELIFGAFEPKTGAVGSVFDVVRDPKVLHRTQVRGGVLEKECAEIMTEFFSTLR